MEHEATQGRDRLSEGAMSIAASHLTWDKVGTTAIWKEKLNIVREASPSTKPYYDMGVFYSGQDGQDLDNWVAEWFLWHSFRYRDNTARIARPQPSQIAASGSHTPGQPPDRPEGNIIFLRNG